MFQIDIFADQAGGRSAKERNLQSFDHLLWRFRRQQDIERVAGDQVDEAERDDRDPEQDQDRMQQP